MSHISNMANALWIMFGILEVYNQSINPLGMTSYTI